MYIIFQLFMNSQYIYHICLINPKIYCKYTYQKSKARKIEYPLQSFNRLLMYDIIYLSVYFFNILYFHGSNSKFPVRYPLPVYNKTVSLRVSDGTFLMQYLTHGNVTQRNAIELFGSATPGIVTILGNLI